MAAHTYIVARVPASGVEAGQIIWTDGLRIKVKQVEHLPSWGSNADRYPTVTRLSGPVLNHAELAERDPWLARWVDRWSEKPGEHWWTAQGNDMVRYCVEVI